jgi:hypothetical protein
MKTLFIHVGPHKTGTTSIQEFLANRAHEIEKAGRAVFLESVGKNAKRANAWALAHCFVRDELQTPMRLSKHALVPSKAECADKIAAFRHWAGTCEAQSCILSSETFSFLRTDAEAVALHRAFADLFDKVTPIVVSRREDQRRRSWQKQLVKMKVEATVSSLDAAARVDGDWYFDWAALTDFWSRFGEVTSIDYQKAVDASGSIIPAFQHTVGLDGVHEDRDYFLNVTEARHSSLAGCVRRTARTWFSR